MSPKTRKLSHVYTVDGLRTLALVAVVVFHMWTTVMPGGFLGVVIFFVLAGFFTSRNMVLEQVDRSYPPLLPYYRKKFIRLYLPLLAMVVLVNLWTFIVQPNIYPNAIHATPSVLLGYNNYFQLASEMSYFEMHGNFQPYTHLWALAMEMQFYLLYPVLIRIISAVVRSNVNKIAIVLWVLAFLSAGYMWFHYTPGSDPTNVYYSTLARAYAFLIGGAFAFSNVLSLEKISLAKVSDGDFNGPHGYIEPLAERGFYQMGPTPFHSILALMLMLCMIVPFFTSSYQDPFIFRGGMLIYSIVVGLFIVLIYHDDSILTPFMASKPMRVIAKRSYSYFIWQYVIMVLFAAGLAHSTMPQWFSNLLQLFLLVVIGEVFYRFLEKGPAKRPYYKTPELAAGITPILACATAVMFIVAVASPADKVSNDADIIAQKIEESEQRRQARDEAKAAREAQQARIQAESSQTASASALATHSAEASSGAEAQRTDSQSASSSATTTSAPAPKVEIPKADEHYGYSPEQLKKLSEVKVTMVGDSVLDMAQDDLYTFMPELDLDAKISRQMTQGVEILQEKSNKQELGDVIVVALGSNGNFNKQNLETLLSIAAGRPLLMVNTVTPGGIEEKVNAMLKEFSDAHDNVHLVDWYGSAKTHSEWFYNDATHPKPSGAKVYDKLIMDKILEVI